MNKPQFKKGDVLQESCGCVWKVLKVGRKNYTIKHLMDKDIQAQEIKQVEDTMSLHDANECTQGCDRG